MDHKYMAKIFLEDDEIIINEGDTIEELLVWMQDQAEVSFYQVKGEIIDNATHKVVKEFQYSPPDE